MDIIWYMAGSHRLIIRCVSFFDTKQTVRILTGKLHLYMIRLLISV